MYKIDLNKLDTTVDEMLLDYLYPPSKDEE